jgi:hypothetical protein
MNRQNGAINVSSALVSYDYCVLRYSQDRAGGEALNVGVVLYCRQMAFVGVEIQRHIQRLSQAFSRFDADGYRRAVNWLSDSIEAWQRRIESRRSEGQLVLVETVPPPDDLTTLLRDAIPDNGLSLFAGSLLCGVTDDPGAELSRLFDRFVVSQYEENRRPKRDDKQVWQAYQDVLRRENVTSRLGPKTFVVNDFEYKFEHAFKNGTWHALQPVSMDYAERDGIKRRVDNLLGEAQVLSKRSELGKLYLLLGKPAEQSHLPAYEKAVRILRDDIVVDHEIVEEEQKEEFGRKLADQMEQYGL